MAQWTKARIQLCGRFVADIDGSRIEDALPGRIGRVLFAYLVLTAAARCPATRWSWPAGERTPHRRGETR
jgi:hypothetical protein